MLRTDTRREDSTEEQKGERQANREVKEMTNTNAWYTAKERMAWMEFKEKWYATEFWEIAISAKRLEVKSSSDEKRAVC